MKAVFERLLTHCVNVYSGRTGRNGLPYIIHPLEVMASVVSLPEKIVALGHDYGEFRDVGELAEIGVSGDLLDRIGALAKRFPDDVPENDPRYCEYIWSLLGDPVCRKVKYYDLLTNAGYEESPAGDGRRWTGQYPHVVDLLKDAVVEGRLYFCSRSLYVNELSNFYMEPLNINGEIWKSGEHYYQAQKFAEGSPYADPATFRAIRDALTPGEAKQLSDLPLQTVPPLPGPYRIGVMETMLRVKFAPGTQMHRRLLQTGNLELIHESRTDLFWGQNRSGDGQNLLGKILMQIRETGRGQG